MFIPPRQVAYVKIALTALVRKLTCYGVEYYHWMGGEVKREMLHIHLKRKKGFRLHPK